MRSGSSTAVVLFTGDVRREERRKSLPRRCLAAMHASLARQVRLAGSCDLFVAGKGSDLPGVRAMVRGEGSDIASQVSTAVATMFANGYRSVIVLAGDVAGFTPRHLSAAIALLRRSSRGAVIGRCRDGGFYLAGFNANPGVDWRALPWFRPEISAALRVGLEQDSFAVAELGTLDDIDSIDDLRRAAHDRSLNERATALSLLHASPFVATARTAPLLQLSVAPAVRRRPPPAAQ